jgi:GNAT superfamily N-acetyltransferase
MSLLNRFQIRLGTVGDAYTCQRLTRQFRSEFPFVTLASLRETAARGSLHIALLDGEPVGFVSYRKCRDGWQTVYELCVKREVHGLGIGRALLYSVPCPIRLKTTVDNTRANKFYANAGMKLVETVQGKKRPLNIYHMRVLSILCMGKNASIPALARASSMAYGTRHDHKPHDWPFMLDIRWDKYDWTDYMHKVCTYHPVQAMVADYECPTQTRRLYHQIKDLRAAGVLRIMVCPKFDGATRIIPNDCVVAVSVPSGYAGFLPQDLCEYSGWRLHLLGGSAPDVYALIPKLVGVGATVISLDGSSHESAAKKGTHYEGGRWVNRGDKADRDHTIVISGRNIAREMAVATQFMQPGLL